MSTLTNNDKKRLVRELQQQVVAASYGENIGKKVSKLSNKPFKSQSRIATIKGVILHPQKQVPAYIFEEDDSCVECKICKLI